MVTTTQRINTGATWIRFPTTELPENPPTADLTGTRGKTRHVLLIKFMSFLYWWYNRTLLAKGCMTILVLNLNLTVTGSSRVF